MGGGGGEGGHSPLHGCLGEMTPRKKNSLGNMSHFFLVFHVASICVSIIGWFFCT
jgi:hypothetical protein